jgi:hypothetical protein
MTSLLPFGEKLVTLHTEIGEFCLVASAVRREDAVID